MSDKWAERYRAVKDVFWWRLTVGDCGALHGRFYSRNEAEHMAALLLREFRNGMFVGAERAEAERDVLAARLAEVEAQNKMLHNQVQAYRDDLTREIDAHCVTIRTLNCEEALLRELREVVYTLEERDDWLDVSSRIDAFLAGEKP